MQLRIVQPYSSDVCVSVWTWYTLVIHAVMQWRRIDYVCCLSESQLSHAAQLVVKNAVSVELGSAGEGLRIRKAKRSQRVEEQRVQSH